LRERDCISSKTSKLLSLLMEKPNRDFTVEEMMREMNLDGKVAATIAARLARRGLIKRTGRGRYRYERLEIPSSALKSVAEEVRSTVETTFGAQMVEKLKIFPTSIEDIGAVEDRIF